tara:strand:+ start:22320 stop:22463 length:144 start_codon:yes stop_codon:yes gene_type:complete
MPYSSLVISSCYVMQLMLEIEENEYTRRLIDKIAPSWFFFENACFEV